jgi:hypothetical protein
MYLKVTGAKIVGKLKIAFNTILFWENWNKVNWEDSLSTDWENILTTNDQGD